MQKFKLNSKEAIPTWCYRRISESVFGTRAINQGAVKEGRIERRKWDAETICHASDSDSAAACNRACAMMFEGWGKMGIKMLMLNSNQLA